MARPRPQDESGGSRPPSRLGSQERYSQEEQDEDVVAAASSSASHHHHRRPRHTKKDTKKTKSKKRKRKKTHRAYGLPNANQIFLTMIIVGMLFIQLLRPNWLVFTDSDATAGLSAFRVIGENDTITHVPWSKFCDPNKFNFTLSIGESTVTALEQPFASRQDAIDACASNTPEIVRILTATSIALSMLSVTVALYFHLGAPSQRQIVLLGVIPGCALLATAIIGTVALALWQENLGPYDNGDCFGVAVASTVIAYVVSVSMAIRWRWPGIFAVENEQQAFEVRRNWRRRPLPPVMTTTTTNDDNMENSPRAANNTFHQIA